MNTTHVKNKRLFDAKTMLKSYPLDFGSESGWETIVEQIETQRQLLEKEQDVVASWLEAVFSWHEEVFLPLYQSISSWPVRHAFGDQKLGDLYLAVSDHWAYMKERDPETTPAQATRSFVEHYGDGVTRYFSRFLTSAM